MYTKEHLFQKELNISTINDQNKIQKQSYLRYDGSCMGSNALCFLELFGRYCKNTLSIEKLQVRYFTQILISVTVWQQLS